jgi:Dyp-type peroxidase family
MSAANFERLEPVLMANEIQGNLLGGFNKDHQAVLPLHFPTDVAAMAGIRTWLKSTLPSITWLTQVVSYKRERERRMKATQHEPTDMAVIWTALAFSFPGLRKLTPEADAFEPVFRNGLVAASSRLGDPSQPGAQGSPSAWTVGGPNNIPDMLAIIAGDDSAQVDEAVADFLSRAAGAGISCPFYDIGHDLMFYNSAALHFPSGREHFGFEDGISQPGVRGRMSSAPGDFLTPRTVPDTAGPDEITLPQFSSPGQMLVCAGEFVLGYPRQNDSFARRHSDPWPLGPEPFAQDANSVAPYWAKNGSFLVYRRLRQDVPAFNRFLESERARLAQMPKFSGLTAEALGAMLIGRWRSGAPFLRTPGAENPTLGTTRGANNAFGYQNGQDPEDGFGSVGADPFGKVCPQAAHIRKVNPRDLTTDKGSQNDTLTRRILRRGIPYGPPLPIGATNDDAGQERGLLFLSYQASIREQFEFLASDWMNNRSNPTPQSSPPTGSGFDMAVGQNSAPTDNRARFCLLGASRTRVPAEGQNTPDFVTPTGGGYFFAPSRSALSDILAVDRAG